MSFEECLDLINAIKHATELCCELSGDSRKLAEELRDELAEYAAGIMAWGLEGKIRRGKQ